MNRSASYFHLTFWILAFVFWLMATTDNHPNWTSRVASTLILTGMSAFFACCFTPRTFRASKILISLVALLGCGISAAVGIHVLYDVLIGPDPRRFPLSTNIGIDTAVILFNTIVAAFGALIVRSITGRPTWFLRRSE